MSKGRIQNRHGTYDQLSAPGALLPEEIGVVDSGHPDTINGTALIVQPKTGTPFRVANADEVLKIYRINEKTVPESEDWYIQGNFYIPTTFEGFTESTPEIVFSDHDVCLWLKYNIAPGPTGKINYYWAKMLTSEDV